KIGKKPLDALLREKVLVPMDLKNTTASQTSEIPSPVLHAFDSERRTALKIPSDIAFTEESTFWNPQWGTPMGANQTTNIDDMITTAVKVGTGALLSKSGYEAMTGPHLLGFGKNRTTARPPAARKQTCTTTGWAWCARDRGCCRTRSSAAWGRSRR